MYGKIVIPNGPDWRSKSAGVLLLLFLGLALMMPATTLWDRDEAIYARTAVEMVQSGSFLVPSFNGEVFAHKPPLIFWLMALSIQVFGVNEFAVRLVSAIGMAGTGWLTFLIGQRLFGPRVGFWAMAVLLTSMMSIYLGVAALLDAVLLLWITLAIWAFVELLYRPGRWPVLIPAFGVALALCQLTKGPVGPAVVGAMVVTTGCFARKEIPLKWPHYLGLGFAATASLGVFLAWAIPANSSSGGEMARMGLMTHVIGRALRPMEGHGGRGVAGYLATLLVYVPVIIGGLFPWTLQLPGALSALAGGRVGSRKERTILWAWIVPAFLMFSLAATKLPHYIFPLFPALALTTAAGLDALREGRLTEKDRAWFRRGIWFFSPVIFGAGLVLLVGPWLFIPPAQALATLPSGLALLALGWVAVRAQRKEQIAWASRALLVAFPTTVVLVVWTAVPRIEPLIKISPEIARQVRSITGPRAPIYMMGYTEPSLIFYLNRPVGSPVKTLVGTLENLAKEFEETPGLVLVSTEKHFAWASQLPLNPPVRELARFRAINTNARAKQESVIVSGRGVMPPNKQE
jgi:4-amino-4-deoxy-L-arabinose transferase-like glycosyltransferase